MADFFIRKGDRAPAIRATLTRDEKVADLTLATGVQFIYQAEAGGTVITRTATIINAVLGLVEYNWAAEDTATVGIFKMYFSVSWPTATPESFPSRSYKKFSVTPIFA